MEVRCEHCHAGYTLPADRLTPGRRVQFSCRHCAQRIVVQVPEAVAEPEPPAPSPDEPRWFVARPDGSYRKLAESELARAIAGGEVDAAALVWCKGFDEWVAAAQSERWHSAFAARLGADASAAAPQSSAAAPQSSAAAPQSSAVAPAATRLADIIAPAARGRRQTSQEFGEVDDVDDVDDAGGDRDSTREASAPSNEQPSSAQRPRRASSTSFHQQGGASEDGHGADADRVDAAEATEAANDTRFELPSVNSVVAGMNSQDVGQAAVSLPVVRSRRVDSGIQRAQPRTPERRSQGQGRFPSASQGGGSSSESAHNDAAAHHSGPGLAARAAHGEDGSEDANWAPATDTYIGPRDRFTRKLGSAAERDLLIAQVERARQHRDEVRRWQLVAVGACMIAIGALLLAGWGMIGRRIAERSLASCEAKTPTTMVAAPRIGR